MPISVACPTCGAYYTLTDDMAGREVRCSNCQAVIDVPTVGAGQPVWPYAPTSQVRPQPGGLAITSLVLGILSLILFGPLAGIPAIILGIIALKRIRQRPAEVGGNGLAIAGIATGGVGTLVMGLVLAGLLLPALARARVVVPKFTRRSEQARITAARTDIANLEVALDVFAMDTGRYPTTAEGLWTLIEQPAGVKEWHGPYIRRAIPNDPWGNPYVYKTPGDYNTTGYDLYSFGPDSQDGGDDDIDNWSER